MVRTDGVAEWNVRRPVRAQGYQLHLSTRWPPMPFGRGGLFTAPSRFAGQEFKTRAVIGLPPWIGKYGRCCYSTDYNSDLLSWMGARPTRRTRFRGSQCFCLDLDGSLHLRIFGSRLRESRRVSSTFNKRFGRCEVLCGVGSARSARQLALNRQCAQ